MAKLPKKKTMLDTINRVQGYCTKIYQKKGMNSKNYTTFMDTLNKLKDYID